MQNNLIDRIGTMESVMLEKYPESNFKNVKVKWKWSMLKQNVSLIGNPISAVNENIDVKLKDVNDMIANLELDFLTEMVMNNVKMNGYDKLL